MKKVVIILSFLAFTLSGCETAKQILDTVSSGTGTGTLTNAEIIQGLKEALKIIKVVTVNFYRWSLAL